MSTPTNDLGPLPAAHPRSAPVERARHEIESFVLDWRQKHGLTRAEEMTLLAGLLKDRAAGAVACERRVAGDGD